MILGIYIQVPFCQTKCTYCNFHTGVVSRDRYDSYVSAVCREIEESRSSNGSSADSIPADVVDTVYFGGGTPSLLEPAALARMLDALRQNFRVMASPEITLEADPETITPEKASAWCSNGINRISLGAQSFNDVELRAAGRMHRCADIHGAVECLRAVGFDNISMDLIAGLPHQTRASWDHSVDELLAAAQVSAPVRLAPEHVSIYMLEVDEGSRLGREALAGGSRYSAGAIPSDDAMAEFYEAACTRLASAGYAHYEISNWALPGFESRHNLKYWRREPYLGFGAGAHSFDGHSRWANVHDAARYVRFIEQGTSPREQLETVTPEQALDEEFFLGLRQLEGIDLARVDAAYGGSGVDEKLASLHARIAELRRQGLVEVDSTRVKLAPDRLTVSNEVFVALLDQANAPSRAGNDCNVSNHGRESSCHDNTIYSGRCGRSAQ
jgi:oxygen-independent coproporphyrinogen III oxidase